LGMGFWSLDCISRAMRNGCRCRSVNRLRYRCKGECGLRVGRRGFLRHRVVGGRESKTMLR
jgi:hypothetical protein